MEKQKRWQFYLIVAVLVLTLYNILPTVFYYSKPLREPIDSEKAELVAKDMVERVNALEPDAEEWIKSFSKLLSLKPTSINILPQNPGLIEVKFSSKQEADRFRLFLPKAGALVPFVPAQLELSPQNLQNDSAVFVLRKIDVKIEPNEIRQYFQFTPKYNEEGHIASLYRDVVEDRVKEILSVITGPSANAYEMFSAIASKPDNSDDQQVISVAQTIVEAEKTFGKDHSITRRIFASFSQIGDIQKEDLLNKFSAKIESVKKRLTIQRDSIEEQKKNLSEKGLGLDPAKSQNLALLTSQLRILESAESLLKKQNKDFLAGKKTINESAVLSLIQNSKENKQQTIQTINVSDYSPFIHDVRINWEDNTIDFVLYDDVQSIRESPSHTENQAYTKDKLNQYLFNEMALISRLSEEQIIPSNEGFQIVLNILPDSQTFLVFNLGNLAAKRAEQIQSQILQSWIPIHSDLVRDTFPINSYENYSKLSKESKKLGLIVYAPAAYKENPPEGFRKGSIYVIARGLDNILQKYKEAPKSEDSQQFLQDFESLNSLMQQNGFIGYQGSAYQMASEFSKDFIFELNDYYSNLLKATREEFSVKGSKRYATLDFSDVEQRILTQNKIDDRIQEDLLKWQEAYNAAQVDLDLTSRYTVPAPTKNPYFQNFKLSFVKYFRGDDRKILKWGLDLSGGKTVRIGLRDKSGRPVTNPDDLKQVVNELYTRVNKLGVAERTIRLENSNIILEFPGSQALSASELVKASAMYFHIVNEKFNTYNPALGKTVNQFLQDVWNEAVVTNRKDIDSINLIAWQHLGGGESLEGEPLRPRSENARILVENGLRLAGPKEKPATAEFDDTISSIAMFRGDDSSEWQGQTHPLIVVFYNYALEGSSLENVIAGFDSNEGNVLNFGVKRSYDRATAVSGSPRDDLYAWTSQFAEDRIVGTPKEAYSKGKGWRMAVILNGSIVTAPMLNATLRDAARISGRFSQREVSQLAADLKAGSLSFTPKILSEENISPELGKEERMKGIIASFVALALVVLAMVGYYRFAGFVASCAVLLNIFIMWGVLQNLGAALTLPAIAGIVLTIGMAVDANVLVFERIREEFSVSGRIASAIQAGYRKAFSAIIDSNITTIIAAVILIQFDSGPIKGFAITLIIGIISSMFTALFMTRYFFAGWVQNPKNKQLTMSHWIGNTKIDFLGKAKAAILISLAVILFGTYMLIAERKTLIGMDFTGGYSLNVNVEENPNIPSYRVAALNALLDKGASHNNVQVRQLSRPNQLRIQLATSMEEKGYPFNQMPEELPEGRYTYEYQKNPRLTWVVNALAEANIPVQSSELTTIQNNWTVMSGQFSDAMRNNALIGLGLALLSILVYITFRFEFKYAVGAVVGLAHDVWITLGILAIFHALGFQVQIDLQVIGAIMTIIGYSLNDTIIVFDRIREDIRIFRKMSFRDIINYALNITLSRTLMTSGTTLLVLLALVLLGGQSIFAFSLVMTIGVVVGTLSSLFIASPVMLYFHEREAKEEEALLQPKNGT